MPGIEFVSPEPDEGDDEELVAGPQRRWSPRLKRVTRIAAGAVLAAVAASVVIGVLTHSGDHHSTSAGVPSGTDRNALAPEAPPSAFRVDHLGGTAPEGARPGTLVGTPEPASTPAARCPSSTYCSTSADLPVAVVFAIQAQFPAARNFRISSVLIHGSVPGQALWSRTLTARSGSLHISIVVHQITPMSVVNAGRPVSEGAPEVRANTIVGGLAVTSVVMGPESALPTVSRVRTLADDRRLLAVA